MADLTGRTVGKYTLQQRLGRGGMAEVYKAFHPGLNRFVAVKILHAHLAEDPDFLVRFRREAQAVAQLRHPHIVQVYDFDVEGDLQYMVMEYIDGRSLKDYLDAYFVRGEHLPLPAVLRLFRAVLEAVGYAHARGIVHRDLKPANVMIEDKEEGGTLRVKDEFPSALTLSPSAFRVVLTDFGIVKMIGGVKLTATGVGLGTPAYMSPEQGLGQPDDARSDIYSLGVMLYEMLTGAVPFDGDTALAVLLKHAQAPVPSLRQSRPDLPEAFDRLIAAAMAKRPDQRFQTAGEMLAALEALAAASEKTTSIKASPLAALWKKRAARASTSPLPTAVASSRAGRGRWNLARLAVGSALFLLLVLGGLFASRLFDAASLDAPARATAQAQLDAGQYQLAADSFTAVLQQAPEDAAALLGRAQAREGLGQIPEALADVEQAIAVAPDDPEGYAERARLNIQYGLSDDMAAIRADFDEAIRLAPNSARAYFLRGWAALNFPLLGDSPNPQAALADLQQSVTLDPQNAEAQFTLARALLALSRPADALTLAHRAVELDPRSPLYRKLRAHVQAALGDFHAAIDDLTAAIDLLPDPTPRAALLAERAYLYHRLGNPASAQTDLERAVSLDSTPKLARYVHLLLDPPLPRPSPDELAQASADAPDDPIWRAIVEALTEGN